MGFSDYFFPNFQKQVMSVSKQMLLLIALTLLVSVIGCIFGWAALFNRGKHHVEIPHGAVIYVHGEPFIPLRLVK